MQWKNENLLPLIFEGTLFETLSFFSSLMRRKTRGVWIRERQPPFPLVGDISATPKVLKSNAFSIKLVDCLRDRFQSVSKQYFPVIILEWRAGIFWNNTIFWVIMSIAKLIKGWILWCTVDYTSEFLTATFWAGWDLFHVIFGVDSESGLHFDLRGRTLKRRGFYYLLLKWKERLRDC